MDHGEPNREFARVLKLKEHGLGTLYRIWRRLPSPLKAVAVKVLVPSAQVGAALLVHDGAHVLLVRQTYTTGGRWALPGGWAKRNESPRAAAERETREELGIDVASGRVLAVGRGWYGEVVAIFEADRAIDLGAVRRSAEIAEARYFAFDALPPLVGKDATLLLEAIQAVDGSR